MGLIPERRATKLAQSALLALAACLAWIGGLLFYLWDLGSDSVAQRIFRLTLITLVLAGLTYWGVSWALHG
jgi:hypothetical protein